MIALYLPQYEDLWFREKLLSDEKTMSYNHAWGGTIAFPEEKRARWYARWLKDPEGRYYYRYLQNSDTQEFVGEIAYHFDEDRCMADVIIHAAFRGQGYGKAGLQLLCNAAGQAGVDALYDDIAVDNPAVSLFLDMGFTEEYRNEEIIMLKKNLI